MKFSVCAQFLKPASQRFSMTRIFLQAESNTVFGMDCIEGPFDLFKAWAYGYQLPDSEFAHALYGALDGANILTWRSVYLPRQAVQTETFSKLFIPTLPILPDPS